MYVYMYVYMYAFIAAHITTFLYKYYVIDDIQIDTADTNYYYC